MWCTWLILLHKLQCHAMELPAYLCHILVPCLMAINIVAFNSCVAANTDGPIVGHWYPVEGLAAGILLTHEGNRSSVVQDRCDRDTTLLYLSGTVYLTRNGFVSALDTLYIPSQLLEESTVPVVLSATFSGNSLIMAVGTFVFVYSLKSEHWTVPSGIPDDADINRIASFQCCYDDIKWCQKQDNSVVAYNSHISTNTAMIEYFLSTDQGQTFTIRNLQLDFDIKDEIRGATVLGSLSAVAFLVERADTTAAHQFVYDYIYPASINLPKPVSLPFTVTGNQTSFVQLESGRGSLVIWDSRDIYYSAVSGKAVIKARLHVEDPHPAKLNTIQQVISNKNGDFAMMTINGDLFFGREGLPPKIVKLPLRSPLPCHDHSCALRFTPVANNILVLYPANSNAMTVVPPSTARLQLLSRTIHVQQRLAKVTPPLQKCRLQGIVADFHDELFYLDLGQTLELNATVIPAAWERNSFMVTLSNPGIILSVNTSLQDIGPQANGVTFMKLFINVALVADTLPESRKDEGRGMSTLSVSVYNSSLMCHHRCQAVARVIAGCPPDRNIKIRKNGRVECTNMRGYVYTISKDAYDPTFMQGSTGVTATEDKEVAYDFDTLGCPFVVYYQDMLKPIVELYDGDTFVEEVKKDFVVNEINGMFTYSYEKTAEEAGCTSQPQTWLLQQRAQDSPNPATAWTRRNYRNCSQEEGIGLRYPNQPYEVLSSRNSNQLKWLPYNGILVFNVTVLDPDYSFCQLRGQFAVQVYGVLPPSTLAPLRIMLGTCGLGLAALVAAYVGQKLWPGEKEREDLGKENEGDGTQEMSTTPL